ncbi:hypothetical protein HHL21_03500 [Massilia sp. RP-1-19]|uniref:Uncharacterized protein n=1 Tax=Massilia polaris TaxID=2728846 RepID=A0A848HG32_9BURK|nr:hypothetical protein [Massilia polaris]NML60164.1 hypothetical protein [Massilia polaris]
MKNGFDPYANEADVVIVGKLMIENRLDRVTLSGDVDLTADQAGLTRARELHDLLGAIVGKLETQALPDALPPPNIQTVKNPFTG